MALGTHVLGVYISTYVKNGTARVTILANIEPMFKDQHPKSGTIHLLIPFNITSLAEKSTPENQHAWHTYAFFTNLRFVLNDFIALYQFIRKNLKWNP